jgi:hypothetical protein
LGGFGKVVEIDESFLPGNPKYGKGHKNDRGKAVWVEQDEEVWVFGLIERGRPDPWLQRVRTRGRKTLVKIINDCLYYTASHKRTLLILSPVPTLKRLKGTRN